MQIYDEVDKTGKAKVVNKNFRKAYLTTNGHKVRNAKETNPYIASYVEGLLT